MNALGDLRTHLIVRHTTSLRVKALRLLGALRRALLEDIKIGLAFNLS